MTPLAIPNRNTISGNLKQLIILKCLELYSAWIMTILLILLAIAFVTLLERKLLGLTQNRLSPNKVSIFGLLQAVLDGIKLFFKPLLQLEQHQYGVYNLMAYLSLSITLLLYLTIPYVSHPNAEYQVLWILAILGLITHLILLRGWASNSKYALLGRIRSLAQAVSYEVVLTLLLLLPFLLNNVFTWQRSRCSATILFLSWTTIFLIESQRAPFDLAEGESELVRGFNVEYAGLLFVYFFLAEYGNLILLALVRTIIWNGLRVLVLIWIVVWLIIRTCFPRIRFDQLISLTWLILLPFILWSWVILSYSCLL